MRAGDGHGSGADRRCTFPRPLCPPTFTSPVSAEVDADDAAVVGNLRCTGKVKFTPGTSGPEASASSFPVKRRDPAYDGRRSGVNQYISVAQLPRGTL